MPRARDPKTRLFLLLGIIAVGFATLLVKQQLNLRELEQAEAETDRPEHRARAALARADQAAIDGAPKPMQQALVQARDALDEAISAQPGDLKLLRSRLSVTRRLAAAALELGQAEEGRALLEEALSRAQALFEQDRITDRARMDLLVAARELGGLLGKRGEHGRAAQVIGEAAASVEAAQKVLPGEAALQGDLADAWLEAAESHHTNKSNEEAAQALRIGAQRAEAATQGGEDPVAALARAYNTLSRAARLAEDLRLPEALPLARRCIRLLEEQRVLTPEKVSVERGLAQWHDRLANLAEAGNDEATARSAYEASLTLRQALLRREDSPDARRDFVRAANSLGAFHSAAGRHEDALVRYQEAVAAGVPLGDERTRLIALGNQAQVLGRLDRMVEAKAAAAEAYALALRLTRVADPSPGAALDAASAGLRHARLLRADPQPDKAAALAVARSERDRLVIGEAGAKGASVRVALEALIEELGGKL